MIASQLRTSSPFIRFQCAIHNSANLRILHYYFSISAFSACHPDASRFAAVRPNRKTLNKIGKHERNKPNFPLAARKTRGAQSRCQCSSNRRAPGSDRDAWLRIAQDERNRPAESRPSHQRPAPGRTWPSGRRLTSFVSQPGGSRKPELAGPWRNREKTPAGSETDHSVSVFFK